MMSDDDGGHDDRDRDDQYDAGSCHDEPTHHRTLKQPSNSHVNQTEKVTRD